MRSAGAGSTEQRLKEQERDGVEGEGFSLRGHLSFWRGIRNDEASAAVLRATTSSSPRSTAPRRDRLLAMGVIRARPSMPRWRSWVLPKAGLKGVALNTFPSGKLLPTSEDDRFWAAAIDLDMPLTVHVGLQRTDGPLFKYNRDPGEVAFGGDPVRVLTRFGGTSGLNAVQMMLSGVFDRYPKLSIYWAETQVGWLPYFYEQLDDTYKRSRHWMTRYFGIEPLKRQPSEYIREHCYGALSTIRSGSACATIWASRGSCGGADFPHAAGDWTIRAA